MSKHKSRCKRCGQIPLTSLGYIESEIQKQGYTRDMDVIKFLKLGYTWYIISITQGYVETKNLIWGYTVLTPGTYHVHVKTVFVNINIPRLSLFYKLVSRISIVYTRYITTLTYLFFSWFRGQVRDSACPPPSINTDTDHSQPVPDDDEFDSRPEYRRQIRQPWKQPLQTFSNASKFRKSKDIGIWTQFCPSCRLRERWTSREFLSQLLWKQVCCRAWITRRRVTSPPLKWFCARMPKIAGVLMLEIFGLYSGYILVNRGISLQLDSGRAREVIALVQGPNSIPMRCSPSLDTTLSDTAAGASGRLCSRVSGGGAVRVQRACWQLSARVHSAARSPFQWCMRDQYSKPGLRHNVSQGGSVCPSLSD